MFLTAFEWRALKGVAEKGMRHGAFVAALAYTPGGIRMLRWYLVTHNLHQFQMVASRLQALEVDFFSPQITRVRKRRDCGGVRESNTPLFPGYLFIRLDRDLVHTSVVAAIAGVREFVRFGGDISTVPNSLIEGLKHSLLLQTDRKITTLECRNVPEDVMNTLGLITLMKSKLDRQAAFLSLLTKNSYLLGLDALISSCTEKPFVNEKIG